MIFQEALKNEKEETKKIRLEYEERESNIILENSKLKSEIERLANEKVKSAERHETELHLMADKHRKLLSQTELNHQHDIKEIYQKSEILLKERNQGRNP